MPFYINQVTYNIDGARKSFENICDTFNCKPHPPTKEAIKTLFMFIHYFLIHVQNIYDIFYPNTNNAYLCEAEKRFAGERRNNLKSLYPKIYKIRPPKNVQGQPVFGQARNQLEHFDTRIDSWIMTVDKQNDYLSLNRVIYSKYSKVGVPIKDRFCWFSEDDLFFHFHDQKFDLKAIFDFIKQIESNINEN
ncbi:MAG: hypothetical protein NTW50_04660 [Candidatus Berkelbacteria bacterium]|nr:hypothetical protein [Candidatus Berkelbacteria bacterium]